MLANAVKVTDRDGRSVPIMIQKIIQSPNYKWWVFGTIAIGTFMSVVDHGSVLIALPEIESHFGTDLSTVQWVVVGYTLAISVLLLPMGRLGDIVGRKQVYIAGFAFFVTAAALAGAAPNLEVLIAAKVVQGIGSAMIQGNGMAAIISIFPGRERGRALGWHLSIVGAGAIVGPAMGGMLISALGWRWVFYVNVPVGLLSIAAAAFILVEARVTQGVADGRGARFDWPGALLSICALLGILLVVGNGNRIGWDSPATFTGAVVATLILGVFIWWELRVQSPMLDLRLFRLKLVALGSAASWVAFLGTSSARFMMPFYLQRVLDFSPMKVGLIMIPPAICMIVVGPLAGRLSDQYGWRVLTFSGLALSAVAWFIFATQLTVSSSVLLVVTMMMLQSIGTGLFNTPNNSSILSAVERSSYGVVSGLTQLVRNSANVASISVATAVIVATMGSKGVEPSLDAVLPDVAVAFIAGLHRAFFLMGGLLVLGAAIVLARGEQPKETPQARPQVAVGGTRPLSQ